MQRLSAWLRWIASVIFTGVIIPVAVHFIEEQPPETANALLKFLLDLAEQTWLRFTAFGLGCFVAGVWLDWLLRKFDGSRAKARENLGYEMMNLAHDIDNALALVDRFRLQDFSPRLISAFIKAKQVGLWTPDVRMPLNVVMPYLRHVGTLLSDGHFAEAKQAALECKEAFEKRAKQPG